jgi:hypothetical protein
MGLASRLEGRKCVVALTRRGLKGQGKRFRTPYPATYTAGETKVTQCENRSQPIPEIMCGMLDIAGSSSPQLLGTPLTASGGQAHLPATRVY